MTWPHQGESQVIDSHIVAGLLGSLLGLKWAPGASWLERLANVGIGFGCAVYLAPGVAEWMGVQSARGLAAMIFAMGMFGQSLAAAAAQFIRSADFGAIIASWLPRRGP
jgi:hypothetical protein